MHRSFSLTPTDPYAPPLPLRLVGIAVGVIAWFGIVFALAVMLPTGQPTTTWSQASGTPPPLKFSYLMFPSRADVPLHTAPDVASPTVAVLSRAMANIQAELDAGDWAPLYDVDEDGTPRTLYVSFSDLTFLPPSNAEQYISAYKRVYGMAHHFAFPDVSLRQHRTDDGSVTITFRRGDDDGYDDYEYMLPAAALTNPIAPIRPIRVAWRVTNGKAVGVAMIPNCGLGLIVATVTVGVGRVLLLRWWRRRNPPITAEQLSAT